MNDILNIILLNKTKVIKFYLYLRMKILFYFSYEREQEEKNILI